MAPRVARKRGRRNAAVGHRCSGAILGLLLEILATTGPTRAAGSGRPPAGKPGTVPGAAVRVHAGEAVTAAPTLRGKAGRRAAAGKRKPCNSVCQQFREREAERQRLALLLRRTTQRQPQLRTTPPAPNTTASSPNASSTSSSSTSTCWMPFSSSSSTGPPRTPAHGRGPCSTFPACAPLDVAARLWAKNSTLARQTYGELRDWDVHQVCVHAARVGDPGVRVFRCRTRWQMRVGCATVAHLRAGEARSRHQASPHAGHGR